MLLSPTSHASNVVVDLLLEPRGAVGLLVEVVDVVVEDLVRCLVCFAQVLQNLIKLKIKQS